VTVPSHIILTVNGMETSTSVSPDQRLIDMLRMNLNLTGTKEGCGEGECGACTVLVDGAPVNACLMPAADAEGCEVTTVEGLGRGGRDLSVVQQAFVDHGGIQCGFCSPGMIMSATALLTDNPRPTDQEIRLALVGNLCRCTGYAQIVESVQAASDELNPQGGQTDE
jgi:aerobic carbon-monoxide dehydrogenase small subunit